MGTVLDHLFSPLSKDFCLYFYYLSVIAFIFLLLAVYNGLGLLLKKKTSVLQAVLGLVAPFLLYFNNRLLYTMCV